MKRLDILKKILNNLNYNYEILFTEKETRGAAETSLIAKNLINNNNKLIIVNSDQIVEWDEKNFLQILNRIVLNYCFQFFL